MRTKECSASVVSDLQLLLLFRRAATPRNSWMGPAELLERHSCHVSRFWASWLVRALQDCTTCQRGSSCLPFGLSFLHPRRIVQPVLAVGWPWSVLGVAGAQWPWCASSALFSPDGGRRRYWAEVETLPATPGGVIAG